MGHGTYSTLHTIMANEAHADAFATQDPRQLVIQSARDLEAVKRTVYRLDSGKRPAAALLDKFGAGRRRGGDERREGGKLGVSLLSFGSGNGVGQCVSIFIRSGCLIFKGEGKGEGVGSGQGGD